MSTFTLTLRTIAPEVEWSAVGGATAGELLTVLYTTDEPLNRARLWLPDGRKLDMAIEADRLTVLLPADTPNGNSWLHVTDDVGNETTRQAVFIAGVIVVPPPESPGTPGRSRRGRPSFQPDQVETRTRRSRSRGVATSRASVSRTRNGRSRGVIDTSSMIHGSLIVKSGGALRSVTRSTTRHAELHARGVGSSRATVRRHDGPNETDALVALGLL